MRGLALVVGLALAVAAWAQAPLLSAARSAPTLSNQEPLKIYQDGVRIGRASRFNFTGGQVVLDGGTLSLSGSSAASSVARQIYVDKTGTDSVSCGSNWATSACASVDYVIQKLPKSIKDPIDIYVGDGGYGAFSINGFSFDPRSVDAGAYIAIHGNLGTFTPTTGTGTGTATSGAVQGSNSTHGTLPDTGQSWTTDELTGLLLTLTGGTGAGQTRVIASNTATVITIVGAWVTTPVNASTTYAIQDWGTKLTSTRNQPNFPNAGPANATAVQIYGNSGIRMPGSTTYSAPIYLEGLKVAPASGRAITIFGGTQRVGLRNVRAESGTQALEVFHGASVDMEQSIIIGTATTAAAFGSTNSFNNVAGGNKVQRTLFSSSSSSSVGTQISGSGAFSSNVFRTTNSGAVATVSLSAGGAFSINATGNRFECTTGGSTRGLYYAESFTAAAPVQFGGSGNGFFNCPTGVYFEGGRLVIGGGGGGPSAWVFDTCTNGLVFYRGGQAKLGSTAETFTTVTNEITVDGTVYTGTAFRALSPIIISTSFGTAVMGP